jgi:hypothetical protein
MASTSEEPIVKEQQEAPQTEEVNMNEEEGVENEDEVWEACLFPAGSVPQTSLGRGWWWSARDESWTETWMLLVTTGGAFASATTGVRTPPRQPTERASERERSPPSFFFSKQGPRSAFLVVAF